MLAVLSPGQGAQKPGFLAPWLSVDGVESQLRWWSALTGVDLVHLGVEADAEEIKDTAKTQPLLTAAALVAAGQLRLPDVCVVAGHSVGELGAAAVSGVLAPENAIALAGIRGREMAAACALERTGMAAILGGDEAEVLAVLAELGLFPANRNGAGQIVAAGSLEGIAKLVAQPPAKARIRELQVAGAFHTPYMASAEQALGLVAAGMRPADPHKILLSNADGSSVASGTDLVARLVRQVTAPVRWDLVMRTLEDLGVTAVIELPPAGTLAGLVKRSIKGVEIVTVNTPDDLAAARDLISRHGNVPSHEPTLHFMVVVAANSGTFAPIEGLSEGDEVKAGQVIGQVVTRQGGVDVAVNKAGVLTEWLANHDDPIAQGQPLARIEGVGL
ncbi:[acyl-carrier-protein] S-malonyltransferase [Allocatelliglobosispora scoriae]|uniref:[acyl-carrier-protein] S-malonyltransferase n=1 Tax=Allocatelliglobosispora scoriae TaxID=643052 RepID=A0A841BRZ5_9ACTN|nr:acyltransferase domain-containing protein [Allocatelliglobosispora scoriae]MBB5869570.1 [acyl-carrier-protein] S-malonyltransferase [Allocatelliglobosispora scoriae]